MTEYQPKKKKKKKRNHSFFKSLKQWRINKSHKILSSHSSNCLLMSWWIGFALIGGVGPNKEGFEKVDPIDRIPHYICFLYTISFNHKCMYIKWWSPKAMQVNKCSRFFHFFGIFLGRSWNIIILLFFN